MSDTPSSPAVESPTEAGTKVLRDPVHDLIYLGLEDRWALDLIDAKEFQRLRRIRQLGVAHLVYPGAEHTRFTHSLGVFNFARRILRKLASRHENEADVVQALRDSGRTVKVAALLHDLGHGPFSHVFERVFRDEDVEVTKHDEWTCRIIRDEETEIHQQLCSVLDVYIDDVCSLIFDNEGQPTDPYLKDIVSSQLDADRMDYLLRDSLMTGSRYGQFDSEWVLNALAIGEVVFGDESIRKLCLDARKGMGAIEGLLFARSLMHSHVYGHKTTRAYEAELVQTLRLAVRLSADLPDDTPAPIRRLLERKGDVTVKEYLMLDDDVMWWALRRWAVGDGSPAGNEPLARALQRHAKRLVRRHRPWKTEDLPDQEKVVRAKRLCKRLADSEDPLQFECYIDNLDDLPYKDYRYLHRASGDDEQAFFREIFLLQKDRRAEPLSECSKSPILEGLMKGHRLCRFCYDREHSEEFSGYLRKYGVC